MRKPIFTALSILLLVISSPLAQEEDSTLIPPPSDTTELLPTAEDTSRIVGDTLTGAEKALLDAEQRRQQYLEEKVERIPNFSFFDSLVTYFASPRLDQRSQIDQSFHHDAGDYFRFDPSFFVLDHLSTPMRKTVRPFGLLGNRTNVINNRMLLQPFEHIIEPDGLIDFNDIPTALDHAVYVIPGAAGLLFGGNQAVASLITQPKRPESRTPESGLIVDQGSDEYNYVRGRYSKLFSNTREIDMSIGYRNANGQQSQEDDDAYHYTGRIFQPIGMNYGINASGQLYSREGSFDVRPNAFPGTGLEVAELNRDRIDRNAEISVDRQNENHDARLRLGYRYLRHGSHIGGAYSGRFDFNGWGLFAAREWASDISLFSVEARSDHIDYTDGFEDFVRDKGEVSLKMVRINPGLRLALSAGTGYIDGYDLLPKASAVFSLDRPNLYFLLSAGYAERAPTLYELHLPYQRARIYATAPLNYADKGNSELDKEKQLIASGLLELGNPQTNLRVAVTGGTIKDGIDWHHRDTLDALAEAFTIFSPANNDIDFVDFSVQQKLRLRDNLSLRSGAAYHKVDYEITPDIAYLPDYQVFSGLELHVYWPQRIMDLFAYGEIVYSSEYDGYEKTGLGNEIIANVKLSFRIKSFRFHYVMQNALSAVYEPREYKKNYGRYTLLGLVWNFWD